jgi:Flp pilus assembly pilin Flp
MSRIASFLVREDAATAVEYSVLLALIMMAMLGAIGALGAESGGMWTGNLEAFEAYGFGAP